MPNPVTVTDLEDRWRPLSTIERRNAVALLADAWAEAKARLPTLEERFNERLVDEYLLVRVIAAMVLRVLKNPDDVQAEAPGAYPYQRDNSALNGELYMTADEQRLLADPKSLTVGVRTIRLGHYSWP